MVGTTALSSAILTAGLLLVPHQHCDASHQHGCAVVRVVKKNVAHLGTQAEKSTYVVCNILYIFSFWVCS